MKQFFAKSILLWLVAFALVCTTSCQTEEYQEYQPEEGETIQANSTLALEITAAAKNNGSSSNFLNGSSNLDFQLPITIIVNGIEITVTTEADYQMVINILNQFNDDDDDVTFSFPITIILSDYTEIVINSQEELDDLIDEYEDFEDDFVECVNFLYPITFNTFNAQQEIVETVTITSDADLYLLMSGLANDYFVSINFPIAVTFNGQTQTITSNSDLQTLIDSCDDSYDDDDYYDYSYEELVSLAQLCTWDISELYIGDNDVNDEFDDYYIQFLANGTLLIFGDGTVNDGTWDVSLSTTGNYEFTIFIEEFPSLSASWVIVGMEDDEFHLQAGNTYMELEKECDNPAEPECSELAIDGFLQTCFWLPVNYNGDDNLIDYKFEFQTASTVYTIYNLQDGNTYTGTYSTSQSAAGVVLSFGSIAWPNVQAMSGDWTIIDCDEDRLEMVQGNNTLVLEQMCYEEPECDLIFEECDDNNDGFAEFEFEAYKDCIYSVQEVDDEEFEIYFYETIIDAETQVNPINPESVYVNTVNNQTIYVNLVNIETGVFTTIEITLVADENICG